MASARTTKDTLHEPVRLHPRPAARHGGLRVSESNIARWTVPAVLLACLLVFLLLYVDPIVGRWPVTVCDADWALQLRHGAKVPGGPLPSVLGAVVLWMIGRRLDLARTRRFAGLMLTVLIVGTSVCHVLKVVVARPRPFMAARSAPVGQSVWEHHNDSRFHSFPSGDLTVAAGFAMVGFLLIGQGYARFLLLLIPLASAAGRICGARHYPSDCLAGMVLGAFTALALWRLQERGAAQHAAAPASRLEATPTPAVEEAVAG